MLLKPSPQTPPPERVAGPDWEKSGPLRSAQVQRERTGPNVYYPQPGDFDNLKETTISVSLKNATEVILPVLLGMRKTPLTQADDLDFITSDAPSTWHDPTAYRRHPYERSVGLNHSEIEITLPISPRHCLLFTHGQQGPTYVEASREWVDTTSANRLRRASFWLGWQVSTRNSEPNSLLPRH